MNFKRIIKLLPLFILIIATAILIITVMTTDTSLVKYHIVGLVLLAIAITTQIFNEKIGYQVTGGMLLIGTFTFAAFTPTIFTFNISILKIDLLCFPTLIIYIYVHRNELPAWITELRK
jgi:hypothetical protein